MPAGIDCATNCVSGFTGNVALTAKPDLGSRFAGWAGACTGTVRTCVLDLSTDRSVMAQFVPLTNNIVFASSQSYSPSLVGTAAYDLRCNQLASAVGLNNAAGNAYIAWMSDAFSTAPARLGTARGFIRVDGLPFADDVTSLAPNLDGTIFVVRADYTSARLARAALDLLYQRQVKVIGLVFNAVRPTTLDYYYYKYQEYYATYPTADAGAKRAKV